MNIQARLAQNVPIRSKIDRSRLSDSDRDILPIFIDTAQAMDAPFWMQNHGDREALLASTADADVSGTTVPGIDFVKMNLSSPASAPSQPAPTSIRRT